jgi:hypothetical protein
MSQSTLTIHPCPFGDRPCDNHICRNAKGYKKYFIGFVGLAVPKPIFCEECIKHLLANVPKELIPEAIDLEAKLRKEITAEYDAKLDELVKATETALEQKYQAIIEKLQQELPDESDQPDQSQPAEDEGDDQEPEIFRCLDCGFEAKSASGLDSHRRNKHGA